ncbi:MAG: hypothetical protein ACI8UO_006600 [Verrucomicrobiales bacterium]|jgi:hypothetical protein
MNPNRFSNLLRAIKIALVAGAVLGFAAFAQADPAVDGVIVDSSWSERRISVRDQSGTIIYFIVPAKIAIAGSADMHKDALAFHTHLRPRTSVRIAKGRQLRRNVFAAVDIYRR